MFFEHKLEKALTVFKDKYRAPSCNAFSAEIHTGTGVL